MIEKFILANDVAVHICDSEQGDKSIVLLHGYLENMYIWEDVVAKIYKDLRVITIDLPGHGISEVRGTCHTMDFLGNTVAAAMQKLGISKYYILGHSMGGYVALSMLNNHPENIEGIIMLSSHPYADGEEKKKDRDREIKLIQSGKKELIVKYAAPNGFASDNRARLHDLVEDFEEIIKMNEDAGIIALLNGMKEREDLSEVLLSSKARQLFIMGEKDEIIPAETAKELETKNPQAKFHYLKNSGHMGYWEEPDEVAKAILEFTK